MARWTRALLAVVACLVVACNATAAASSPRVDAPGAPDCGTAAPLQMVSADGARQLITVVASSHLATTAIVTAWQRTGACWTVAFGPWIGRVGRNGVRLGKREGDGATPLGIFDLYSTIYGNAPNPGVHYRYRRLRCGDWWDEDVRSRDYNSFAHLPCGVVPPFANGESEPLWLSPQSYASFAVIGYNAARIPGLGSAIFLHASVGRATTGCVAVARPLLDRVLDWLRLGDHPHVAIATTGTLAEL